MANIESAANQLDNVLGGAWFYEGINKAEEWVNKADKYISKKDYQVEGDNVQFADRLYQNVLQETRSIKKDVKTLYDDINSQIAKDKSEYYKNSQYNRKI